MIVGVGIDLIEIDRIKKACKKEIFIKKAYTDEEYRQSKGHASFLAGNFAVKEAISKCFGTGFSGFELNDIEVLRDIKGKPYVNLYGNAKIIYQELKASNIQISISNTKNTVVAYAVIES